MPGRRAKLTPEVHAALCEAVAAGNYYAAACARVGIDPSTLHLWLKRGRREREGVYFNLFTALTRAKAEAEQEIVKLWREQIPTDWRAARDFLARRFPARWGPKEEHTVTGKGGTPVVEEVVVRVGERDAKSPAAGEAGTPPGAGGVPGQ